MFHEHSFADHRAEIDSHLETVLGAAESDCLASARATMETYDDRRYGQLVALSYDSVAERRDNTSETESILPAATAIELLRGYCRLRSELLVQVNDEMAHSLTRDPTAALLAGDYLYTSAYSALCDVDTAHLGACVKILTTVSETIIEAFSTNDSESSSLTSDQYSFFDKTAGSIGEGAAILGATLADVDSARRDYFAKLGHGFGTARQIHRSLDTETGTVKAASPVHNERHLRKHAEQRRDEAHQALQKLSSTVDITALRMLVNLDESGTEQNHSSNDALL